jgi:hypothetical protein
MDGMFLDVRHASRMWARSPAFAGLAVLILATGIGAATLMFSLVHAALLRSLPFSDPDRVVWMYNLRAERDRAPLSIPDVEDYRRESSTLAGLAVFTNWTVNLTGIGPPERLEGARVSGNFFSLLGLRPLLGRPLQVADDERDARVIVLTHGLWIRRFGADPTVVGRTVSLNGSGHTVVGVLPPGFMFPFREAELAVPLNFRSDPRRTARGANFLRALARLAPGVTVQQAKADLDAIAHRLQRQYPIENARKTGISLYPLHTEMVRDYRTILRTLFGAVSVLLAVGCGNLARPAGAAAPQRGRRPCVGRRDPGDWRWRRSVSRSGARWDLGTFRECRRFVWIRWWCCLRPVFPAPRRWRAASCQSGSSRGRRRAPCLARPVR